MESTAECDVSYCAICGEETVRTGCGVTVNGWKYCSPCYYGIVMARGLVEALGRLSQGPEGVQDILIRNPNKSARESMEYSDIKTQFIEHLKAESALLRTWVLEARNGGWSTEHVDRMRKRADALDELQYQVERSEPRKLYGGSSDGKG